MVSLSCGLFRWSFRFPEWANALLHIENYKVFSYVGSNMIFKVCWARKWFCAQKTTVRFLSCVSPNVIVTFFTLWEWFVTKGTTVRGFSSMNSHMRFQITRFCKWFGAQRTDVRFLTSMNSHMIFQITWLSIWFWAQRTNERFLSWMSFDMSFNMIFPRECFVAWRTTEWLRFGLISHKLFCTISIHFWLKIWGDAYLLIGTFTTYQFPKIKTVILKSLRMNL